MTFPREDLTTDVVVTYNNFEFPSNLEITEFRTIPVLDKAGRTFIGLRHAITVQFHVNTFTDGVSADQNVAAIRTQLMQPAACLILGNTAFGNYRINPAGGSVEVEGATGAWDLAWGPLPKQFTQKPYYKYGSTITWTCEFLLNACAGTVATSAILEWNYGLSFAIDQSGYTTRNYKGSVSIPMTRKTVIDRTLSGNVDELREKITPAIPIGFRRTNQSFELSDDKRTLSFNVVDQQMPPNVPPAGVVVAEASHDVDVELTKNFRGVVQSIRASYEVPSNRARGEAWQHFLNLVTARTATLRALAAAKKVLLMPISLHCSEPEIYGRKAAEFRFVYVTNYTTAAQGQNAAAFIVPVTFLMDTLLWQPIPNAKWTAWNAAMIANKVATPRGTANLMWNPTEDAIVDLCEPAAPQLVELTAHVSPQERVLTAVLPPVRPSPDASWLKYECRLEVQPRDNVRVLETLPTKPVNYQVLSTAPDGYQLPYGNAPSNIVQLRGGPNPFITLSGEALRAGYAINPPQLLTIGDQRVIAANGPGYGFKTWIQFNAGIPIVAASWRFRYVPLPEEQTMDGADMTFYPPENVLYGDVTGKDDAVLVGSGIRTLTGVRG